MKIYEAINEATSLLKECETPFLDAQVILCSIIKKDRLYLHMNRDMELDDAVLNDFFFKIERRVKREPVQYITGNQEFMGLDFFVKEGVLIPRPDTEILVEKVLEAIKEIKNPVIIDVGCGSGAISVSLAKYKEDAKVYSLDIMETPLEVTKYNAKKNGVDSRVEVIKSDTLTEAIKMGIIADVVVSNPPYIKDDVIETLMEEVKGYEPYEALSGGGDGLYFYRKITKESREVLKQGGLLAYEIGHDEGMDVRNILLHNQFSDVKDYKDLAGLDRVVMGIK